MAAHAKKKQALRPLTFEVEIKDFLDCDRLYYSLENEYAIVDNETGKAVGIVYTGRVEIPAGRESAGVPCTTFFCNAEKAGSALLVLHKLKKKRWAFKIPCD